MSLESHTCDRWVVFAALRAEAPVAHGVSETPSCMACQKAVSYMGDAVPSSFASFVRTAPELVRFNLLSDSAS